MLRNAHVLITGASGFVGRRLSIALMATVGKVTQLVHTMSSMVNKPDTQIILDLTDRKRVAETFTKLQPNYVIHLAGIKDRNNIGAQQFRYLYETNIAISLNVIEACLELHNLKKLIYLGSCDEYGQGAAPFDEMQREMPVNSYGLSKLAVTNMLLALYHSHHLPSVVLRPTVIYGPNQGSEMFLSGMIQSLLINKDFLMTLGDQFRDFVYVDDVVGAIIKVLFAGDQMNGKVVNIGAGVSCQIKKIAMLVANLIHPNAYSYIRFGAVQYRQNEVMDYAVNIMLAKQLLGWYPNTPLEKGLQQTINHFRDHDCSALTT